MTAVSSARKSPMSVRAVEQLRQTAFVGGVAGLELTVSRGGTRAWRVYYRVAGGDGRRRALSLGRYPAVGLAEARKRAAEALAIAGNGEDPKASREEKVKRTELTVVDAIGRYLAACASTNDPKTLRDKRSAFDNHFSPVFGPLPVAHVDKASVLLELDRLADRPAIRRNLYTYLRHFFGWAVERGLMDAHPLLGVKPPKPVPVRERVLTDHEIRAVWRARGAMRDIAGLSLVTAQRKGSIEAMRWDEIDFGDAVWTIPGASMKSGRAHQVPLSQLALEILEAQRRFTGPFIFGVGTDGARPYAGASNGFEGLKRQVGFFDWRLHDLRRTAVTLAQRGGASIEEIRALTQHKTPGVIGVYARHAYAEEKRRVAEVIAAEVRNTLS